MALRRAAQAGRWADEGTTDWCERTSRSVLGCWREGERAKSPLRPFKVCGNIPSCGGRAM